MKTCGRFPHLLVLLITVLLLGKSTPAQGDEDYSDRFVRAFHLPLVGNYGGVEIFDVPMTVHFQGAALVDVAASMSSPVFAASGSPAEARRDINLISLSKIKISAEYLDKEANWGSEANWIIDVSKFEQPAETDIEIQDTVQYILLCLRLEFSPALLGKVHIVIRGAQESMGLSKFEGLLWQTDREKMHSKQR